MFVSNCNEVISSSFRSNEGPNVGLFQRCKINILKGYSKMNNTNDEKKVTPNLTLPSFNSVEESTYEQFIFGDVTFTSWYSLHLGMYDEGFDALVDDIALHGIQCHILVDEQGLVIDGVRRLRAAQKLKMKNVPVRVISGLSETKKYDLSEAVNVLRRHLTLEQIKKIVSENQKTLLPVIIKLRKEGQSLRQIGQVVGLTHETVRCRLEKAGIDVTDECPEFVLGKDGKKYRSKKIKPQRQASITVATVAEAVRAIAASQSAGDQFPKRDIPLKRAERIVRKKKNEESRGNNYEDLEAGLVKLMLGDFRDRCSEIEDNSVDMVITDPLYCHESLPIWLDLSRICSEKLKPGGILVTYSGVQYLPNVLQMLGEHLTYLWTAAIRHSGSKKMFRPVKVNQAWKPILIYYKKPLERYWDPFLDMVSGGEEKTDHPYQQSTAEALHYIKALARPNATVWDPLVGSGTSLVAGLHANLGLTLIGCEIDKAAYAVAQQRITAVQAELSKTKESA